MQLCILLENTVLSENVTKTKDKSVADLHIKILEMRPPCLSPIFFIFSHFWGKIGRIICWRPAAFTLASPLGNPGSTAANAR